MNRWLLLLALLPAGCSTAAPYVTTIGALRPGATLTVRVGDAPLSAFAPTATQRRNVFTIAATALPKGPQPPAPALHGAPGGVVVVAPNPLSALLVRVPDRIDLLVDSRHGDVSVTDISGNASVVAGDGNVTLMLPGYAQAAVGRGNLKVTMGSTNWPGTLHFSTQRGDVELRINPTAGFTVHLHTDDGTLFTDFGLTGVSKGHAETIDGSVNGGGAHGVDVETHAGAIQLLRQAPQP